MTSHDNIGYEISHVTKFYVSSSFVQVLNRFRFVCCAFVTSINELLRYFLFIIFLIYFFSSFPVFNFYIYLLSVSFCNELLFRLIFFGSFCLNLVYFSIFMFLIFRCVSIFFSTLLFCFHLKKLWCADISLQILREITSEPKLTFLFLDKWRRCLIPSAIFSQVC